VTAGIIPAIATLGADTVVAEIARAITPNKRTHNKKWCLFDILFYLML